MPAADARRVRQRAERGANRAAIVAAAEAALRERPFREVSVEELSRAAGLARTQFYRHFDDLADLVLTVTAGVFEDLLQTHEELAEAAPLHAAGLRAAIEPAVAAFAAHGPLVRAAGEAASHDAAVEEVLRTVTDRYVALTERVVRRAVQAGADLPHPGQTARMLHLANVAYLVDAFGRAPKVSEAVACDTVARTWGAVLDASS